MKKNEWIETFKKAHYYHVIDGKLKVPNEKSEENIILVKNEVEKLKEKIFNSIDKHTDYIDDFNQEMNAVRKNKLKEKSIKMLDEKLKSWLDK